MKWLVLLHETFLRWKLFNEEVKNESEIERTAEDKPKRGILTGGKAINPFTEEEIPILIADYVLYEYGTGAVMGVPAHDTRDFKFAKENNLPISPDEVEFVTLGQFEALQDNFIWLVKHGLDLGYISRARAAELLHVSLIDLDIYLGRTDDWS